MNKKESKIWPNLSMILSVLLMLTEASFIYTLFKLSILPQKYFSLLICCMLLITLIIFLLIYFKPEKSGTIRKIFALVLALIMICASALGSKTLLKLGDTFTAVTEDAPSLSYFGFYIRSDEAVQTLEETNGYVYGICESFESSETEESLSSAKELLGTMPETRSYNDIYAMLDGFERGEVQGIIMNEAYLQILSEADGYKELVSDIKEVYRYGIASPSSFLPPPPKAETRPAETPLLIYLSGTDTYYELNSNCRSDVNILAAINPCTKEILLVSTPRDYFIPNPAADGALDKLTHLGIYGVDCSAKGLSDLYKQPVSYTARINFTGFEKLIDAMGGVNIYSENGDGIYLSPGDNFFDGKLALQFARDRSSYAGGDRARGVHQMELIKAMLNKLMSGAVIKNYSEIMDAVQGLFITDMPAELISEFIKMQLDVMPIWDIQSFSLDGEGGQDKPYSLFGPYAYVMYPDTELVEKASDLIGTVLDGSSIPPSQLK